MTRQRDLDSAERKILSWYYELGYTEDQLRRAVENLYPEWREAHPEEIEPVVEQGTRFGCSACEWKIEKELPLFEFYRDYAASFQVHVEQEHPDQMYVDRPTIVRKAYPGV